MVKGISKMNRPITTFGVRHCRGIEERQEGTLMVMVEMILKLVD